MSSMYDAERTVSDGAEERWRPIPGVPFYELSDRGRVRSWADWPGRTHPLPRILRGQTKHGRHVVQFGRHGGLHRVDDLMHRVWRTSEVVQFRPLLRWRRAMFTEGQHAQLVRVLELMDSPVTRNLLVAVRRAKRVRFHDLDPHELALEDEA